MYSRAFFEWDGDSLGHGLKWVPNEDLSNARISIKSSGQFPRVAATCFLLGGYPSCFSPLVTYSRQPTHHAEPGGLLENFGKKEIDEARMASLTLNELVNFDFSTHLPRVRKTYGFHKFRGLPTTALLLDVITLFLGSSLARYDVLRWKRILEGKDNSYRIHFEETYERFLTFGTDLLLALLESPLQDFDQRLIPSQPSPYSAQDQSRFRVDPDSIS